MSALSDARRVRDEANDALSRAVVQAYLSGATIRQIQAESRLSAATVLKIKDKAGLAYKRGSYERGTA